MSENFDHLIVKSHKGNYSVTFGENGTEGFLASAPQRRNYIVDSHVAALYEKRFASQFASDHPLLIEAIEPNKDLRAVAGFAEALLARKVRRGDVLVAIGGGIIQDITCFLASTLLRGIPWYFVPTTLLAQADSCIGSKSSINLGQYKNILGTFNPPEKIHIDTSFLATLSDAETRSGIGEMLKVHALDGLQSMRNIARDYDSLLTSSSAINRYIRASLSIKKGLIEQDEFDRGIRNLLNYGHSFGHAIESATNFAVPHGVAVSIGMDMANFVSARLGMGDSAYFDEFHPVMRKNFHEFASTRINLDAFLDAIGKDKKNTGAMLTLILPDKKSQTIEKVNVEPSQAFKAACATYFETELR